MPGVRGVHEEARRGAGPAGARGPDAAGALTPPRRTWGTLLAALLAGVASRARSQAPPRVDPQALHAPSGQAGCSGAILTTWAQAAGLCVAVVACVLLLWQLHRLRVHVLSSRVRLQMRARQLERERITRELHDTLLQGVFGLLMRFQSVAQDWPDGQPARQELEAALDSAEATLTEGRRRISQLRDRADDSLPLSDALSQLASDLARDSRTRLSVEFGGQERALEPALREEIYGVAAEALMNAFQHAQAAQVRLELRWDASSLHVRVVDDGVGMAAQLLRDGRPAHWGIVGMRERADSIGATLTLTSRPRQGTTVALHVRTPQRKRPRGLGRLLGRR